MTTVAPAAEVDRSATLQQATREFAGVYERNAYLVYNLALRICANRGAAIEAARAAFLACLSAEDPDSELVPVTVQRALANAREKPTVEAAGDADAQELLRATASLPGAERAILALEVLTDATPDALAAALESSEQAATSLRTRAWGSFARAVELAGPAAERRYRAWLWAEPPTELWEGLYPSFYAQLVRRLQTSDDASPAAAAAVAAAPKPSRRARRRARRAEKAAVRSTGRRAPRLLRPGAVSVIALLAGAAAGGAYATGLLGARHHAPVIRAWVAPPPSAATLSPARLRALRAQERRAALAFAAQQRAARQQFVQQQQARQRLAARLAAAKQAAKRRQAAAKRAAQLARQQALLQSNPQPPPAAQTMPTTTPTTTGPAQSSTTPAASSSPGGSGGSKHGGGGNGSGSGGNPTSTQAQQTCLYNANDGSYVCPQH